MSNDLEIIAQLGQRLGIEIDDLGSYFNINYEPSDDYGYILNEKQQIVGLGLNGCNLTEFPLEITKLKNLEKLDLSFNQLTQLPPEIGKLQNLTFLRLKDNQLNDLTFKIVEMQNLIFNYLLNDNYNVLSSDFKNAPDLLDLLRQLLSEKDNNQDSNRLNNLKKQLQTEINSIKNLQLLSSRYSRQSPIPHEISKLKNLVEFSLEGNKLTQLPPEIGALQKLSVLNVGKNKLDKLPDEICNLQNLTELYLHDNNLEELPLKINRLQNLIRFSLRYNRFTHFPQQLLELNLDIRWLSGGLYREEEEADVHYQGNWYNETINVADNSFEVPPIEIVQQGKQAITEYFMTLENKIRLNELKLTVIGDSKVGKTSLVKQLHGETFNPQELQTHGINIQQLNFSFNNKEIKLNCWDFGGQQIMHATHQLFFSKRGLYLLVVDSRSENNIEYWLKYLQTFEENAPVIIVINKIDETPHFDVPRRQLKQNYPNIKAFCRLSCATNEGISFLKNAIQDILPNIQLFNTFLPQHWIEVKNIIVTQVTHDNFIDYDHYINICQQHHIIEENEQRTLINFLHDLGLVIHFSDARLRETNVIDPQWLTEAIYTIINAPSLATNRGKLPKNQLADLLNNPLSPSHKHDYLLESMKKFELYFALNQKKRQQILLPDLFSIHEPDFDFDFQHAIHFILEYDFLPKSIFTRLIVRMHHAIKNNYYWRTGVVLFDPTYQTTAFIETNQQQLKLHLQGNKAREYLTVLQFVLNDIHQSFSHLKITHKIGLPDHPEITVSYEYLLKLLENKQIDYVPPELPNKSYKITELLGIFSIEKWSDDQIAQMLTSMNQVLENIGLKQEELLTRGEEIFEIKPELMGVSVDLKVLWRKFKRNN